FCGSAMRNKGEGELRDDRLGFLHSSNCTVHSALVVGRTFNPTTKSCEFLVRDSYGPGCVDTEGKPRYDWDCENGSVWMDSKQLMKSTFHLFWL
ncbi:MAG: hypothetical protein ACXWQO_18440, partial [Bdellovibrionota bacterium]